MRVQRAFEHPLTTLTLFLLGLATVMALLGTSLAQPGAASKAVSLPSQDEVAPKIAAAYNPRLNDTAAIFGDVKGLGATQAPRLVYRRGFSMQFTLGTEWLTYGWSTGFHATALWKRTTTGYGSLNSSWVPSQPHASAGRTLYHSREAQARLGAASVPSHKSASASSVSSIAFARGQILRGDNAGGISDGYLAGQCTEGAFMIAAHTMRGMGNAGDWDNTARARHYPTGYTPRVGATVVFERGVAGASWAYGHVAHVVAVSGSRFQIKEMNGTAGAFRWDLRWVSMQRGISFIYY